MNNYNKDIAHCDGKGCPLAMGCQRFQLYRKWKEMRGAIAFFLESEYDADGHNCKNRIEI